MKNTEHKWHRYAAEAAAIAGVFLVGQVAISTGMLAQYYQIILTSMFINIILAVSLNLINGFTGQLSLGHAGFMAVGAYAAVVLTEKFDYPFMIGILGACLAAALAGLLIGMPTLRLKGDYLAIATLGFGEMIRVIIDALNGILMHQPACAQQSLVGCDRRERERYDMVAAEMMPAVRLRPHRQA